MFDHILTREREVFWQYGEVTCAAFSLKDLDSVSRFSPIIGHGFMSLCGSTAGRGKIEIHLPSRLINFSYCNANTKMLLVDVADRIATGGHVYLDSQLLKSMLLTQWLTNLAVLSFEKASD